jgi:acyl-CoA synthetase (AMP-forming)/AMP-acid ligase II
MLQEKEKEKKGEEKWRSEGGGVVTSRGRPATSPHAQHAAVEEVSRARGGVTASLSLRAVLHEAGALAAFLRGAEGRVAAGDRVGVLLPNSPLFVVVQYAIAAAGAIAVNCNTRLAAPELRAQLADAGVKVVVADDAFAPTLALALGAGGGQLGRGGGAADSVVSPSSSSSSFVGDVLVLWAPAATHTQTQSSSGSGSTPPLPPPGRAGLDRQRRLVFSSSYERVDYNANARVFPPPRPPWTPEEGDGALGARYFQFVFTSGTTAGGWFALRSRDLFQLQLHLLNLRSYCVPCHHTRVP